MPIEFHNVSSAPLQKFSGLVPAGALVGLVGAPDEGPLKLLELAADPGRAPAGMVTAEEPRRWIGPNDALDFVNVQTLCLDRALALRDPLTKRQAMHALHRLRTSGASILVYSQDFDLLRRLADEVWWIEQGNLAAKGDPGEVLDRFEHSVARQWQEWTKTLPLGALSPTLRRGDGRAEVVSIETLDRDEQPTLVWQSGQLVNVRIRVKFHEQVKDPVVGMMIRTRIGMEVYGTNTELEKVALGPVRAGQTLQVTFSFVCHLCPQEYTLTAASHDPDGVWHDWLEDAVAFSVADSRYTAGVANLRAAVTVDRV